MKRKALSAPHVLPPQTHTQMTVPAAGVSQTYSAYPKTNRISPSGNTNTSNSSVDSKAFVVTGTQNKKDSKLNPSGSKRKLFSQRKSVMEFAPAYEDEKSTQSSECQAAAVAQVHHSTLNSKSDDGGCSRSTRYAAVACARKKSHDNKNITINYTEKSEKESLMEVANFTQKMTNCLKTRNTDGNKDSRCISQNSCHEGTNVYSGSHDDSLNEEYTGLVGTEHNNMKLKYIIPNNQNTTEKSPGSPSDKREETNEEYQENSTNLICIQPLRDANDCGEVQGIKNIHDTMTVDGNRKNGSDISLHDIYKICNQEAGQLSYQKYIKETMNACTHSLGYPEMIFLGSNGKEQEPHSGHTAEHASEQNAIMRLSSANSRTATNTSIDTLPTQQHPTVSNSEGSEYTVEGIICSNSQSGQVTGSDIELPGSSSLKSGKEDVSNIT